MTSHQDRPTDEDRGPLAITVDNEDDGRRLTIHIGRGQPVQRAIDELYGSLGRGPNPTDRLRCAAGDGDVLPFATLKLKDYLEHCPDLHWLFAGPTGGAGL
jgi:hypothetical protein